MLNSTLSLKERSKQALADQFLHKAVRFTTDRLAARRLESTAQLGEWESWRERGQAIRRHTIHYLDYYLDQFVTRLEEAGGQAHFARDAREAVQIALDIAQQAQAKTVVKSKSMVSEELHINDVFARHGITCYETDLGEYIVQLAEEVPSHIIIPAIHKNREQIQSLFSREAGQPVGSETKELAAFARRRLRQAFLQADIGMTGCNFAISEAGAVVLFSNEGNARMTTTLPPIHIVFMGMERIIPSWSDLEVMANLLPRSATGQKLTVYMTAITGPRRRKEQDGARQMHLIILDNGRSRQLGDPDFQDILNCIRCGACLNVCPVYRQVGGHAYGSVYPGPIGAVLTPLLNPDEQRALELPYASSLCAACYEACPVKIPLHDMLVYLRQRNVKQQQVPRGEQLAMRGYAAVFKQASRYRKVMKTAKTLQRYTLQDGSRLRWLAKGSGPLRGWLLHRRLPYTEAPAFREQWPALKASLHHTARKQGDDSDDK